MRNRKSITGFPATYSWSAYVTPKTPKNCSKGDFLSKIQFQSNKVIKVCYKVSLCENSQKQSCSITIPPSNGFIDIGAKRNHSTYKLASKWPTPLKSPNSRGLSAIAELLVVKQHHVGLRSGRDVLALQRAQSIAANVAVFILLWKGCCVQGKT